MSLTLDTYRPLGRSGLRVSPLALGTATFGTEWGWGAERDEARKVFDLYIERGGNFIDTSSNYTDGSSELMLGDFLRSDRNSLVLATKYSTLLRPADPNSGGGHRKSMVTSVETSLRQLATDYLDVLFLHVWDSLTPLEETLRAMDDLVRHGKVLYVAISTAPAWQISRMQTIADLRGWSPLIALQIEYNLTARTPERDLIPMARALGLGVTPFSPLAGGVLTGKYSRADLHAASAGPADAARKDFNLTLGTLTERNLTIAETVREIATELDCSPAQVALAWTVRQPGVGASILGARTSAQLADNLGALDIEFTEAQRVRLDEVSAVELGYPHDLLAGDHIRKVIGGDLKIETHSG